MRLYAVEWCPCIYESAYGLVSLHHTRKRAVREKHRLIDQAVAEHNKMWAEIGETSPYPPLHGQDLRVRPVKVYP